MPDKAASQHGYRSVFYLAFSLKIILMLLITLSTEQKNSS